MKRGLLITIIAIFAMFALLQANVPGKITPFVKSGEKMKISVPKDAMNINSDRYSLNKAGNGFEGGIIFYDDFEPAGGDPVWQAVDLTTPPPERGPDYWIVDDWNALGDSSWRLADLTFGTNGGYANHWYQVLDTPPLLLNDTTAMLSFYHRYSVEGTAGATAPYDGWDACNVRISLDSGKTWIVLPHATYNMTNSWAFGHPDQGHFEYVPDLGVGSPVPGWGGDQLDWVKVSFNLKEYVSSSRAVMIRWAFASDMGYSTADGAPDLFCWQLDSIMVSGSDQVFFSNYGETKDLVGKDNAFIPPPGGNLWHTVTFTEAIPPYAPEFTPTPIHSLIAQNGGDVYNPEYTYNSFMENTYETGPIFLPDTTPIYLDFKFIPYFADEDEFPDVDFWWAEVKPVDSTDWEAVWLSEGGYYVFSQGFDQWTDVSYFYGYPTNTSGWELTRFAGQSVYLRMHFHSDYDQPIGPGLLVDDFVVYSPIKDIVEPTGLTATPSSEDTTIHLRWDYEEGKVYQVWRTTPGDQYVHLIGEVMDSVFVDENDEDSPVEFYQLYYYSLRLSIKYEGTSDFTDFAEAELIPENVVEVAYDDGIMDSTAVAPTNKLVFVKFTPTAYPVDLSGFKIYLDKTGATSYSGQFYVWADDGENGKPGTKLTALPINKSGLVDGYNRVIFTESIPIDSGSYYISYKRFGAGLKVAIDTTAPTFMTTYLETAVVGEYDTVKYGDAILHMLVDQTRTPKPLSGLFINEFMASNDGSVLDENNEADDWLEIYNANAEPVDVGGLYLTDDLSNPYKWMIPDTNEMATTIPAGGFLLFFADEQTSQGVLHADFKLGAGGEQIGITEDYFGVMNLIDTLSFGQQKSDTSYGRLSDGSSEWAYFSPVSAGASNSAGTVVAIENYSDAVVHEYRLEQNYPNPFNPVTTIEFALKQAGRTRLNIYNTNGQKVATIMDRHMPTGVVKLSWNASKLASGVYFYELKSGDFRSVRKMILMK